jgi:hypothetical protein
VSPKHRNRLRLNGEVGPLISILRGFDGDKPEEPPEFNNDEFFLINLSPKFTGCDEALGKGLRKRT